MATSWLSHVGAGADAGTVESREAQAGDVPPHAAPPFVTSASVPGSGSVRIQVSSSPAGWTGLAGSAEATGSEAACGIEVAAPSAGLWAALSMAARLRRLQYR